MAEPEEGLPEVYLHPGESRLVREPSILRTLLGSCVGIAFRVPRLGVGALCHPMLPRFPAKQAASLSRSAARRYVDYAIRDLARQFDSLGVATRRSGGKAIRGWRCAADVRQRGKAHGRQAQLRGRDEGSRGGRFYRNCFLSGGQTRHQHLLQYQNRRSAA